MTTLSRRLLLTGAVTGAAAALPRFALAQGDTRPAITVAVQKLANTNTLDPMREQSSNASERWMGSIIETPIARNQQGHLERVPGLAAAWRRIDDRTVELSLRPGVKFHNGDELTGEDVAFSFGPERMFGPNARGDLPADIPAVGRRYWPALERVEVVDRHTVRFVNATPDVTMEGRLSAGGSQIVSRRAWTEGASWLANARHPVGTGPYKLREFVPDVSMTLDAHDDYWGGRPPLKSIRFLEVPEAAARANGLLSGEYQFAADLSADQIPTIEGAGAFQVLGGLVLNHRIVAFDKHHPVLADARVRLAMAHAIDGQAVVDALWAGRSRVPPGLQWEFYGEMFVKGWTVPPHDPAKARELLRAAGYKGDPVPYRIRNDYYTAEIATAQILAEFWKQVGLNVQIEVKENWSQVLNKAGPRGMRDWSNSATFDDPVSSIVNQHGPKGAQQTNGEWTNAEMNTLSVAMQSSTDMALRKRAFARMLQICEREDPAYIVLHQNAVFTGKPKALPWRAPPSFFLDFGPRNWGA
ncbi:MAG: ABC transporter substrate-binding protein [Acetobacteraceae bacterium SCN 69-10]|nr:ABC transporter substrate-binding protein [Rhodospirillales bacterium]ODU55129.1 MAG: ABC transporter substrate-binding protein [Acetobacteraceae bacterium SCN 69-10]OJY68259.1 MAG: ABC transporter substrate-binding protein [Rhodospirillales bacterium 70-18]